MVIIYNTENLHVWWNMDLKTKNHIWIIVSNVLEIYKSLVLLLFIFLIKLYSVIFIFKIV